MVSSRRLGPFKVVETMLLKHEAYSTVVETMLLRHEVCSNVDIIAGAGGSDERIAAGMPPGRVQRDDQPTHLPVCRHRGERQAFGGPVVKMYVF